MRHKLVTAIASAALVVGVSVAEGAVRAGNFSGRTSAKDPVGLKVNSSGRVYGFYFSGVKLRCSDGDSFSTSTGSNRTHSPTAKRYRVSSSRRFTIFLTSTKTGFGWTAKGRFSTKGGSAAGTLRVLARFDIENNLKPKGRIKCDSGVLSWTAKRR
ncbi:MAG: hypothetical protein QOH76_2530 [Thermoleophilaceae bacterium]|jgi:hypothetical protein|nr:hypothetical protein [Thermoleophilaceae bacterium]